MSSRVGPSTSEVRAQPEEACCQVSREPAAGSAPGESGQRRPGTAESRPAQPAIRPAVRSGRTEGGKPTKPEQTSDGASQCGRQGRRQRERQDQRGTGSPASAGPRRRGGRFAGRFGRARRRSAAGTRAIDEHDGGAGQVAVRKRRQERGKDKEDGCPERSGTRFGPGDGGRQRHREQGAAPPSSMAVSPSASRPGSETRADLRPANPAGAGDQEASNAKATSASSSSAARERKGPRRSAAPSVACMVSYACGRPEPPPALPPPELPPPPPWPGRRPPRRRRVPAASAWTALAAGASRDQDWRCAARCRAG